MLRGARIQFATKAVRSRRSVAVATSATTSLAPRTPLAGTSYTFLGDGSETVDVLAMLVANDTSYLPANIIAPQVCFLVLAHLLSDSPFQAAFMVRMIVGALFRAVEHDQMMVIMILAVFIPTKGVYKAETCLADILLAYVALGVRED